MNSSIEESRVRAAVARVWREEAPHLPFDEALSWRDAGVDSLKSLHILMKLETSLGRAISFDLFTLDTRLGEVIDILGGQTAGPFAATSAEARGQVFLLPGIGGDEPILAAFRHSLAGRIRFETLAYPGFETPVGVHSNLDRQMELILEEVDRRQPGGSICIAGYSFGAYMAFEAARRLGARGRDVGLVVLLDALTGAPEALEPAAPAPPRRTILTRLGRWPGETLRLHLERLVFRGFMKLQWLEWARRVAYWTAGHTGVEQNNYRRWRLLWLLRERALRQLRPGPLAAPVLLVTSDDYEKRSGAGLWPALCSDLTVCHVGGGHHDIFRPEALAILGPAFLDALARTDQGPGGIRPASDPGV